MIDTKGCEGDLVEYEVLSALENHCHFPEMQPDILLHKKESMHHVLCRNRSLSWCQVDWRTVEECSVVRRVHSSVLHGTRLHRASQQEGTVSVEEWVGVLEKQSQWISDTGFDWPASCSWYLTRMGKCFIRKLQVLVSSVPKIRISQSFKGTVWKTCHHLVLGL